MVGQVRGPVIERGHFSRVTEWVSFSDNFQNYMFCCGESLAKEQEFQETHYEYPKYGPDIHYICGIITENSLEIQKKKEKVIFQSPKLRNSSAGRM